MTSRFNLKKLELKATIKDGSELWAFDKDDTPVGVYLTKTELMKDPNIMAALYHDMFNQVPGYENYPTSAPITLEPINFPISMKLTLGKSTFVSYDGVEKPIDPDKDVMPILQNGRVLLPVRTVVETLGGTINWNGATSSVLIDFKGRRNIKLNINSKIAVVDSEPEALDVAPTIMHNRTFVPVRFVAENLGYNVQWELKTQEVIIKFIY